MIEDLHNFKKERANGLYGPLPFVIANSLISVPWLFLIAIMFSIITYWLGHFNPTAGGFWMWVVWLFLDLLAAEGLVVLVSSIFPIFVVSLAVTAFANGLWMCVNGFLVPMGTLNPFWKCELRPRFQTSTYLHWMSANVCCLPQTFSTISITKRMCFKACW